MSIKIKLIILTLFSLVVTSIMGFIIFQNITIARKEVEKQVIISDIRSTILEREVLRNEYFLYHEERPIVQSQILSEFLRNHFLQVSNVITLPEEQDSLKNLRDNSESINQTFSEIVASPSARTKELEQRLIGEILIKSQGSITIASQLANASRSRAIDSQDRTTVFVLIFFVSSTAVLILTLAFIWLFIAQPLIVLKEAAQHIASLDFSTTTTTTTDKNSNDEIGQLAGAFNEMIGKLKEFYKGLEEKVKTRTDELNQKVEELERLNKLMVGRELKMMDLKKEMEELRRGK